MSDWIELNLPYDNYKENCFVGKDLNIPGTLIDTKYGIFLIGHINPLKGVCDDCVEFRSPTIVKRYKIVWTEEQEK